MSSGCGVAWIRHVFAEMDSDSLDFVLDLHARTHPPTHPLSHSFTHPLSPGASHLFTRSPVYLFTRSAVHLWVGWSPSAVLTESLAWSPSLPQLSG